MNWGYRLLLVFIVFGIGMAYLIFRSVNTEFDLVEKDYYNTELRYQEVIDNTNNADALSTAVTILQSKEGIKIIFPAEMKHKQIGGDIWIYCAYDRNKDHRYKIETDEEGIQWIPTGIVKPGTYIIKINWKDNRKGYYCEKTLTVS